MKVAVVVAAFPQASVAVKVTVTAVEQSAEIVLKLLVHVTTEHVSEAAAFPFVASHAAIASPLPFASHSTVMFDAWAVITGAVMS